MVLTSHYEKRAIHLTRQINDFGYYNCRGDGDALLGVGVELKQSKNYGKFKNRRPPLG